MKKRNAIILTAALSLSMALFAGGCADKTTTSESSTTTASEKVTPTFMYFYTNNDVDVVEPLIEDLKSEYDGKVNFSMVNIDENPEALENFSLVSGNTPALIMLNTNNDISKFEFQCTDEETLKADIEEALQ